MMGRRSEQVAACMVYTSFVFCFVLLGYGLWLFIVYGQGSMSLFVGVWICWQTSAAARVFLDGRRGASLRYDLWKHWRAGAIDAHPVFAAPVASHAGVATLAHPGVDPYLASLEKVPQKPPSSEAV